MGKAGRPIVLGKRLTKDLFDLDEGSSIPIWVQIKTRLVYLIASGYFVPDDKLPTVRGLAAEIGVNYNTVSKVYQSLEEEGYVTSVHRQGTFVCAVDDAVHDDVSQVVETLMAEHIERCCALGLTLDDVERRFILAITAAKRAEDEKRGKHGTYEQESNDVSANGARIVSFAQTADNQRRSTGNRA